ncbi:MAG TPA: glutamate--tRNA ligase, partial [Thermoanaerobaculia bacterium]|nr:glutamate--tRNA ligase [Thermoanaerobaculia bacterium]
ERAGWIGSPPSAAERATALAIVTAAAERLKVAGDILDYEELFVADSALVWDEKAFAKRLQQPPAAAALLGEMRAELATAPEFTPAALEALFTGFVAARGLGLGAIVHAVRVAVSGKAVGFGLFDLLSILGRERVLARIDRALARLAAP